MEVDVDIDKQKIYEYITGSHLYGTNSETSDIDYYGVFMPTIDQMLGFFPMDEYDTSIISKLDSGKNNADAVDRKFFSIDKYLKLLSENNPNIISSLYVPDDKIIYSDKLYMPVIMSHKKDFLHLGLVDRFVGYANGQKHKMIVKTDKMLEMQLFLEFLSKKDPKSYVVELKHDPEFERLVDKINKTVVDKKGYVFCLHDQHLTVGDLNIPVNIFIKDAYLRLQTRISKATNRTDLVLKYGMDTKFSSHLIRLLMECKELLTINEIRYPLVEREYLLDIKRGKFDVHEVLEKADALELEIKELAGKSNLPKACDIDLINNILIGAKKYYIIEERCKQFRGV